MRPGAPATDPRAARPAGGSARPARVHAAAAALLVLATASGHARAAIYMKFDGIEGSVSQPGSAAMPVDRVSWLQVAAGGAFEPRSGRPIEILAVNYTKIEFERAARATFSFAAERTLAEPYLQIELENVLVSSYSVNGGGDVVVVDGYSGATVSWVPRATANDPEPALRVAHWDLGAGVFRGVPVTAADVRGWGGTTLPDGTVSFTSAVPEPGTWGLGLAGLTAVLAVARRRQAASGPA